MSTALSSTDINSAITVNVFQLIMEKLVNFWPTKQAVRKIYVKTMRYATGNEQGIKNLRYIN